MTETSSFDRQFLTLATELPFFFFPDKFTVVVGAQDRLAFDGDCVMRKEPGIIGCEWKSTKGKTRYWNEEKWLQSIEKGHQIAIYALAQHEGFFVVPDDTVESERLQKYGNVVVPFLGCPFVLWQPKVKNPFVMVRAITKENPPQIWPSEGQQGFEFSQVQLKKTRDALIAKAAGIRAMRMSGAIPWQLRGIHCENRFSHTLCQYHDSYCAKNKPAAPTPEGVWGVEVTDPARSAFPAAEAMLRVKLDDPRVVILSASSYSEETDCNEKYRLIGIETKENFYQDELNKGTGLHAALKVYYREMSK